MLDQDEIKDLTRRKNILLMLCRQSNDRALAEHRDMTKEEKAFYDSAMGTIKSIRATPGFTEESDEKRAEAFLSTVAGGRDQPGDQRTPEVTDANSKFLTRSQKVSDTVAYRGEQLDPGKAIRGMITNRWDGAEGERRAMAEQIGSTGGFLLTPAMSGILVDFARNKAVCVQAGALTVAMTQPEMIIGKVTSDPTASWVSEGADIPETEPTFDRVTLKAQVLAAMCKISLQLSEDAANVDQLLRTALSGAIATAFDKAALVGSGVGEPRGVLATPGISTYSMGANGTVLASYDPFSYAAQAVFDANGVPSAVVMSPRTAGSLDRLKNLDLEPLAPPASFVALQKFQTNNINNAMTQGTSHVASCAIVGDYSQLVLGILGGSVRIEVSRERAFENLSLMIRAYIRADIAVLRPQWFDVITGILA